MRKRFLVALFAIGLFGANAQSVKFGAKAGINFSSFTGDDTEGLNSRTGFHVGGVAELKLTDEFSLQPELLYTELGAKGDEGDQVLKTSYLSLPVMAKYYLIEGLSVEAGPQASILLSDKVEENGQDQGDADLENFDLGLNLGLGYTFENGIFLQSRYTFGLSDVAEDADAKNGALQFSVGYQF